MSDYNIFRMPAALWLPSLRDPSQPYGWAPPSYGAEGGYGPQRALASGNKKDKHYEIQ